MDTGTGHTSGITEEFNEEFNGQNIQKIIKNVCMRAGKKMSLIIICRKEERSDYRNASGCGLIVSADVGHLYEKMRTKLISPLTISRVTFGGDRNITECK